MEPIAAAIKTFLGTLGFSLKHTRVDIRYEKKAGGKMHAYITAEGPLDV